MMAKAQGLRAGKIRNNGSKFCFLVPEGDKNSLLHNAGTFSRTPWLKNYWVELTRPDIADWLDSPGGQPPFKNIPV